MNDKIYLLLIAFICSLTYGSYLYVRPVNIIGVYRNICIEKKPVFAVTMSRNGVIKYP
ncbi:hypothetical protein VQ7734_04009 [Vibrio quintilis]|uniref:Uncharacterized protein n=1 Tax=Vibrio quintilis TaxID=1117707 RepID=A0A1M7YZX8_9VIBR|nr:hypothetical protein VQ7734_04009 [Vibrio quintilis]